MPKTSEAMRRAIEKYQKEKCDEIRFRVPKGRKAAYLAHAQSRGESLTRFLMRAAEEQMKRDKEGEP